MRSALGFYGLVKKVDGCGLLGRSDTPPELGTATAELAAVVVHPGRQGPTRTMRPVPSRCGTAADRGRGIGTAARCCSGAARSIVAQTDRGRGERGSNRRCAPPWRGRRGPAGGLAPSASGPAGHSPRTGCGGPGLLNWAVPHPPFGAPAGAARGGTAAVGGAHADLATAYLTMPMTGPQSTTPLGWLRSRCARH